MNTIKELLLDRETDTGESQRKKNNKLLFFLNSHVSPLLIEIILLCIFTQPYILSRSALKTLYRACRMVGSTRLTGAKVQL